MPPAHQHADGAHARGERFEPFIGVAAVHQGPQSGVALTVFREIRWVNGSANPLAQSDVRKLGQVARASFVDRWIECQFGREVVSDCAGDGIAVNEVRQSGAVDISVNVDDAGMSTQARVKGLSRSNAELNRAGVDRRVQQEPVHGGVAAGPMLHDAEPQRRRADCLGRANEFGEDWKAHRGRRGVGDQSQRNGGGHAAGQHLRAAVGIHHGDGWRMVREFPGHHALGAAGCHPEQDGQPAVGGVRSLHDCGAVDGIVGLGAVSDDRVGEHREPGFGPMPHQIRIEPVAATAIPGAGVRSNQIDGRARSLTTKWSAARDSTRLKAVGNGLHEVALLGAVLATGCFGRGESCHVERDSAGSRHFAVAFAAKRWQSDARVDPASRSFRMADSAASGLILLRRIGGCEAGEIITAMYRHATSCGTNAHRSIRALRFASKMFHEGSAS